MANGQPDWTDGLVFDPETEEQLRALRSPFADVIGPNSAVNPSVGLVPADGLAGIPTDQEKRAQLQRAAELAGTAGFDGPLGHPVPKQDAPLLPLSGVPEFDADTEAKLAALPPFNGAETPPAAQFAEPDWETGGQVDAQGMGSAAGFPEPSAGAVGDPLVDPLQYQADAERFLAEGELKAAKTQIEMQTEERARASRANLALAQGMADFDQKVTEFEKRKPDPGWEGNTANIIGLILGGLFQASTGKTNPALAALQQQIDNNSRAFDQETVVLRSSLDFRRASLADRQAFETQRAKDAAANEVATINNILGMAHAHASAMQPMATESTLTLALQARKDAVLAAQAKALAEENKRKEEIRQFNEKQKVDVLNAETARKGVGVQAFKAKTERTLGEGGLDLAWVAEDRAWNKDEADRLIAAGVVAAKDRDLIVPALKNPDGSPFLASDPITQRRITENLIGAGNATIRTIDEAIRLRDADEFPGEVTTWPFQTDRAKRNDANREHGKNLLRVTFKSGALDKGTDLSTGKMWPDGNAYEDPRPALRQLRKQLIEARDAELEAAGYKGHYEMPELDVDGFNAGGVAQPDDTTTLDFSPRPPEPDFEPPGLKGLGK